MTVQFFNPRLHAEFTDWPMGRSKRGPCVFDVEHKPGKGYRFSRTTTGKPKTSTYGGKAAIVDGDNGKTYLLQCAGRYDFVTIHRSDMMCADPAEIGMESAVWPKDARYAALMALIDQANDPAQSLVEAAKN